MTTMIAIKGFEYASIVILLTSLYLLTSKWNNKKNVTYGDRNANKTGSIILDRKKLTPDSETQGLPPYPNAEKSTRLPSVSGLQTKSQKISPSKSNNNKKTAQYGNWKAMGRKSVGNKTWYEFENQEGRLHHVIEPLNRLRSTGIQKLGRKTLNPEEYGFSPYTNVEQSIEFSSVSILPPKSLKTNTFKPQGNKRPLISPSKTPEHSILLESLFKTPEPRNSFKSNPQPEFMENNEAQSLPSYFGEDIGLDRSIYFVPCAERFDDVFPSWKENLLKCDIKYPSYRMRGDTPISIAGQKAASELGEVQRRLGEKVDVVYSSPSLRSIMTASKIISGSESEANIKIENGLYNKSGGIALLLKPEDLVAEGYNIDLSYRSKFEQEYFPTNEESYEKKMRSLLMAILRDTAMNSTVFIICDEHAFEAANTVAKVDVEELKKQNKDPEKLVPCRLVESGNGRWCARDHYYVKNAWFKRTARLVGRKGDRKIKQKVRELMDVYEK